MKKLNILKGLFTLLLAGSASVAVAQVYHPLAFPAGTGKPNWYANYVGLRLTVNTPGAVAGDKVHTDAYSGGTPWSVPVLTAITADAIGGPADDSDGCAPYPAGYFTGKIALVYRGTCNFSCKAQNAEAQGAVAIIIINNVPGGPVGMAQAAPCLTNTKPVFMISKEDGDAIYAQYNQGQPVNITITPWGQGFAHDLGILNNGGAQFPAYAMPYNQLAAGTPIQYKNVDGAFIANFGSSTENNITLASSLSWTPTGGSTTVLRSDSLTGGTMTVADSIIAMYETNPYTLTASAKGRYDLSYNVHSGANDGAMGNNSLTYSMYTTDNIWSKGRYDFTNDVPISTIYEGATAGTVSWGPNYYIQKGYYASSVKFAMAQTSNGIFPTGTEFDIYAFKWVDGFNDGNNAYPKDGFIEGGELTMVGKATYITNGVDSSEEVLSAPLYGLDGTSQVAMDDTSWYWFPAVVPSGFFLGCDGVLDFFPRSYGKYHNQINATNPHDSTNIEPYGSSWGDDANNISGTPNTYYSSFAFDNSDVDSVNYFNQVGLVPSIALYTSLNPVGVKTVGTPLPFSIDVFPNPATDVINVALNNDKTASRVSYTVIDAVARLVTTEVHNNVQNDKYTLSTAKLSAGTYYVSVVVDGKSITKKFVVVK